MNPGPLCGQPRQNLLLFRAWGIPRIGKPSPHAVSWYWRSVDTGTAERGGLQARHAGRTREFLVSEPELSRLVVVVTATPAVPLPHFFFAPRYNASRSSPTLLQRGSSPSLTWKLRNTSAGQSPEVTTYINIPAHTSWGRSNSRSNTEANRGLGKSAAEKTRPEHPDKRRHAEDA
ncbi:hypothetical protein N657DRAFT_423510 [Parathielavia appendiculata]|uniref:Uncharacterized protein n=1 Tax=Parathielavia appendiculata TaxID=2587402 RepID=A0AAN6U048_9PEZI|nr:hypothetical protein N657DRAFT_423510 [Parathielavia appendiculata]